MTTATSRIVGMGIAAAALLLGGAPRAQACGGFFCDNNQPVNQAAERIIFAHNGDGTVTAVVQILYQGPSDRFAWVLPVPGSPDVGISSNTAFARLQRATNPQYRLNTIVEGRCREDGRAFGPPTADFGGMGAGDDDDGAMEPVTVIDEGTVGPFDFQTISLDPTLPDPGDVAVQWLEDNGYDVADLGKERLGPYLADGMNLIAFRLTKGVMAGSIRPIVLTYDSDHPMIPIRPTAVAANDDMGVLVWVLGESQAVTTNYKTLVLNEALIDWFNPARTYDAVVSTAANEAQGQGFVTEYAEATASAGLRVFQEGRESLPTAEEYDGFTDVAVVADVVNRYTDFQDGPTDGLVDAMREALPEPPAGVTINDVLNCPRCIYDDGVIPGFEVAALIDALDSWVVEPLRETQRILDSRPYVTRMYTTMSADEMTMDPEFELNPDLDPVSNVHVADRIIECSPRVLRNDAPWRVELPQGGVVRGEGNRWPFAPGTAAELPANQRIEQASTAGANEVVTDNVGMITAALDAHNATVPGPGAPAGGGGCTIRPGPVPLGGAAILAGAVALLWTFRRRRPRRRPSP